MNKIYLLPGKYVAVNEPCEMTTILGSCVAICLFDEKKGVAGMNHFLLPGDNSEKCQSGRYGQFATESLVQAMESLGSQKSHLKAKIFGGGSVLGEFSQGLDVGKGNIKLAEELLEKYGISIVEKKVGGREGCRIIFRTDTFEVTCSKFSGEEMELDVSGLHKLKLKSKCRVLIIDDSATVRTLFQNIFTKHGLMVVGTAANAFEARELIARTKPDVMTLDIEMPMMSGVAFLEKIMKYHPIPTVMVSSLGSQGEAALKALQLGAIEFVQKPSQYDVGDLQKLGEFLVERIRAAAHIRVAKNQEDLNSSSGQTSSWTRNQIRPLASSSTVDVIAVAGNSGAAQGLTELLVSLPSDTPPVLVSCSTVTTFLSEFINDLKKKNQNLAFEIATHGMLLKPGHVYFAPLGKHLKVKRVLRNLEIEIQSGHSFAGQIPSGSVLFESVAEASPKSSAGVLLSGFGRDGVDGLTRMQELKCYTLVQDPKTSQFPFATQAAVNEGVADEVCAVQEMASFLLNYRNRKVA